MFGFLFKKIFADRGSLTGSIGVVSLIPNIKELVGKIDINVEELKKSAWISDDKPHEKAIPSV